MSIDFGATLEVIDGPTQHDGIETVHVKDVKSGKYGHVFYRELQASSSARPPTLSAKRKM